jgi:hypothetical protein
MTVHEEEILTLKAKIRELLIQSEKQNNKTKEACVRADTNMSAIRSLALQLVELTCKNETSIQEAYSTGLRFACSLEEAEHKLLVTTELLLHEIKNVTRARVPSTTIGRPLEIDNIGTLEHSRHLDVSLTLLDGDIKGNPLPYLDNLAIYFKLAAGLELEGMVELIKLKEENTELSEAEDMTLEDIRSYQGRLLTLNQLKIENEARIAAANAAKIAAKIAAANAAALITPTPMPSKPPSRSGNTRGRSPARGGKGNVKTRDSKNNSSRESESGSRSPSKAPKNLSIVGNSKSSTKKDRSKSPSKSNAKNTKNNPGSKEETKSETQRIPSKGPSKSISRSPSPTKTSRASSTTSGTPQKNIPPRGPSKSNSRSPSHAKAKRASSGTSDVPDTSNPNPNPNPNPKGSRSKSPVKTNRAASSPTKDTKKP